MVRKLMAVAAVSGLMMSTALAQTKTDMQQGAANKATNVQAITAQAPNQWLGSTLIGMTVVDPDNNTIGEVNDMLVEKSGKVEALIVGVGGFLGIGERDVALPMAAFAVVPAERNANTGSGGTTATSANNTAATASGSDRLRLSMTKDQLQQHAEFRSAGSQTTGSGASTGTPSSAPPGSAAPRAGDNAVPPAGTAR